MFTVLRISKTNNVKDQHSYVREHMYGDGPNINWNFILAGYIMSEFLRRLEAHIGDKTFF